MTRFFVAVLVIIVALAPTAAIPVLQPPKEKAPLYFPTTVGDTAVYLEGDKEATETVTKVEDVDGAKIVSLDRGTGTKVITSNYQRVRVSEKGVALVQLYRTKFDPLVWELRLPAKVGSKWSHERAADAGNYFDVRVIDGVEAVEVPAGRYMAVKVVRSRTLDNRQIGVHWYAPRVGLVKSEYRAETGVLETRVLKSFTPGDKADAVGTWKCEYDIGGKKRTSTLTITKDGDTLAGTMSWPDQKEAKLKDVKLKGTELTFSAMRVFMENKIPLDYKLTITGDNLQGKGASEFGGKKAEFDITGKREKKDK